ncbi:DNA polymerase [Butyrivibrio sp. AD3002]|uniref:DNA polymerase n=1 Tax=Butyrivibrio sp. AD3002 TaxID=1280670 RepID=UPI0003B4D941|nr:DNA polymerase [Butyrivibrio sp. AD3002]
MTKPDSIKTISIDLETYSDVNIKKCGVYKYADSESFDILLFSYSLNGSDVEVIDLAQGEELPEWLIDAIVSEDVIKWAFNATFERVCLSKYIRTHYPDHFIGYGIPEDTTGNYLDPSSWRCSMIWAATLGLPLSLEGVGAVLGLEQQKMKEGKALIKYFCCPCAPTKVNGGRTRNLPCHDKGKWNTFKSYNIRDVVVEQEIQKRLSGYPVPDSVWEEYHRDQEINDRGILLDMTVVQNAIKFDAFSKAALIATMKDKTELENPNSVQQMKDWLSSKGIETGSLDKKAIVDLIKTVPTDVADVLTLRQQLAKSSVKKYQAMEAAACSDKRARGMFQFYGANRTGRWAGRIIQLQNLPQNHLEDLDEARAVLKSGDYELMNMLYDNIPDILSQLIRTAFVAKPGYKFVVSDFSAIEARVLAFLAGEQWRIDVFARGEDIYCASASAMFHVPVVKHGKNGHLRQKGKIAELALGYGGSKGALISMGALDMGLSEDELQPLVDAWRASNPNVVQLWWDVDAAVKTAIKRRTRTQSHGILFEYKSGMLFITLPSGRKLSYVKPRMGINQFGSESPTYEGVGSDKKWTRLESYGPKFVENIVQGISRDILCNSMRTLSHCFIVGHVHDELIIECREDASLEAICEQMGRPPEWLPGIKLRADGYETQFYKKD